MLYYLPTFKNFAGERYALSSLKEKLFWLSVPVTLSINLWCIHFQIEIWTAQTLVHRIHELLCYGTTFSLQFVQLRD